MKEEIIAYFKRKDGFVKEMVIPEIEPRFDFADIPPMKAYPIDTERTEVVKRSFLPVRLKMIVEYEEI